MSEQRDSRITPATRKIILTILDNTPVPFTANDQEWMADVIEDKLRERFDLTVDSIDMEGNGL